MTAGTALGLALEITALAIMLPIVRRPRMAYIGVIFIICAFVFHGAGELLQHLYPGHDYYRRLVPAEWTSGWMPIVGSAFLIYAVAYVGTLHVSRVGPTRLTVTWFPPARVVTQVAIFLWLLAVGGTVLSPGLLYWGNGLMDQFLLVTVTLAAALYVRTASRWGVLGALVLQAGALVLVGERTTVIAATVAVLWAASLMRRPIGYRIIVGVALVVSLFAIAISAARIDTGRQEFITGSLEERLSAVRNGALAAAGGTVSGIGDDFIYRFDGNAWPAYVRNQMDSYAAPSILAGLRYDFAVAVPRFIYGSKLSTPEWQRSEEAYLDRTYGIPYQSSTIGPDWLPTQFGSVYAYGGWAGLALWAFLCGLVLARVDIHFHRGLTFPGLVVGLGTVLSIAYYERGIDAIILTFRGIVLIWAVARIIESIVLQPGVRRHDGYEGGDRTAAEPLAVSK
jgi:hypothetical protein